MPDTQRFVFCAGCGAPWAVPPGLTGDFTVETCEHCPPDLETQLEDLLDEVWRDEREWSFDDRLDMALKQPRHVTSKPRHVCDLPPGGLSPYQRSYTCPRCNRAWVKPTGYLAWQPQQQ